MVADHRPAAAARLSRRDPRGLAGAGTALLLSMLSLLLPLPPAGGFCPPPLRSAGPRNADAALRVAFDPNERETSEERRARMELVRGIQRSFYPEGGRPPREEDAGEGAPATGWIERDPDDPTVIESLPLWRTRWTELPGGQRLVKVEDPLHAHMFRRLVLEHPEPWLFGHASLPWGEGAVGDPEHLVPGNEGGCGKESETTPTVTLMRVADYVAREGGRLTLVVQGVGRIRVLEARQQLPYAVAKVRMLPDDESWGKYFYPLMGIASCDHEMSMALMDATKEAAVREDELFRDLEYRQTRIDPVNGARRVPALVPVDGSVVVDPGRIREEAQAAFSAALYRRAGRCGSDEVLLASTTLRLDAAVAAALYRDSVLFWETRVWLQLDRMAASSSQDALVPPELLALMPVGFDWPAGFQLSARAEVLDVGARASEGYPPLRRAVWLSYAVWTMLADGHTDNREAVLRPVLEAGGIIERLQMAHEQLLGANRASGACPRE